MSETNTTCPYCGVGCGVTMAHGAVTGDPSHPANHGKLCIKGATLAQTLDDSNRLTHPAIGGRHASWDEALDLIAEKFAAAIAQHGPSSVAIYGSGQFLTEDYYVANKLMKGFIGTANIDTNSRLCMSSTVAGHIRAFGEDIVPTCYDDIDQADLLVFTGANSAWCHPVLFERAQASRARRGAKIVVIDPRKTATAALADLHLPISPDADVALFQQLLCALADRKALDETFITSHTAHFAAALQAARETTGDLGIPAGALETFFGWFAKTPRTVTLFSQGVNQSATGTDKVNAITNVHLATGRIGKPGAGPFSLTGQPNAMGGREAGGLANLLAAHMSLENPAHRATVQKFWRAPTIASKPGLKAVDMFDAVLRGQIKVLWIAATNPAESLPRAERVRAALEHCPFVVVADCWPTETTRLANVVLPAAGWGEKNGTVTNSERTISRQRPFRAAPGHAKPDWWMFASLAQRLGHPGFRYASPAEIFREHAALSGFENTGDRLFDISDLAATTDDAYDSMPPFQWPHGEKRLFTTGAFATPTKRANFIPLHAAAAPKPNASFPFTLNTGRLRDQWHTMTRTGFVPALMQSGEACLTISEDDARAHNITTGDLIRVTTRHASAILPAHISASQNHHHIFAAMHFTSAYSSAGSVNRLVGATRDAHSGQPASKHERAAIEKLPTLWYGILQSKISAPEQGQFYAARIPLPENMHRLTLAGWKKLPPAEELSDWAARLCGADADDERVEFFDAARAAYRLGTFRQGRLTAALFIHRSAAGLPSPETLATLFKSPTNAASRTAILRDAQTAGAPPGRIVCVCHHVPETTIKNLIRSQSLTTVAAIGAACKAGTNCGSCKGELAELLTTVMEPAE